MSYEAGGAADAAKTTSWRGALMSGVLTNVLNPKALLFCSVLLPQFVSPASGPVGRQFAVLGVILVSLGLAFDVLCALAGRCDGALVSASPKAQKIQSLVFGTALIGFGLRLTLPSGRLDSGPGTRQRLAPRAVAEGHVVEADLALGDADRPRPACRPRPGAGVPASPVPPCR